MDVFFGPQEIVGTNAKLLNNFPEWTVIKVLVKGAITFYFSTDRKTLEQLNPSNAQGGLKQAAGDNIKEYWWIGPLYGITSASGVVAVEAPAKAIGVVA